MIYLLSYEIIGSQGNIYDPDMDFTRDALGKNMGSSRESHEKHMRKTWEKPGKPVLYVNLSAAIRWHGL